MNSIDFYKNYYKGKKILLVVPKMEDNLYDLLNEQIQSVQDVVEITLATSDKNLKELGTNIIHFDNEETLLSNADEIGFFKVFFIRNGYIYVDNENYSVLWEGFIEKLKINGIIKENTYSYYTKIFEQLNDFKNIQRIHFINLQALNSLKNEMFLLSGAEEGNGMVLVKKNGIYQPIIKKINLCNDFEKKYLQEIFEKNKKYFKKDSLDFENDELYVINLEESIPVGMFEIKDIDGEKELGTVALSDELKGKNMFPFIFEAIFRKLSDIYDRVVVVTPNDNFKKILNSFSFQKVKKDDILSDVILSRYDKMLQSNKEDGKNRDMFIVNLYKF